MFRPKRADSTLIVVHIPKTAGTTLAIILTERYGADNVLGIRGAREARQEFAASPELVRGAPRLITGHQPFGLHAHVPRACDYLTFLRDPVERVVSHYYHVLHEETHYLRDRVVSKGFTLEEYVENPMRTPELDNHQTRMLADYELSQATRVGGADRSLLESAKLNLDTMFACVGLTERFDETMVLLTDALGWARTPYYLPARVSSNKPKRPIPEEIRRRIRELNRLDVELYEHVAERFDAHVRSLGPKFAERVERVRAANLKIAEEVEKAKAARAGAAEPAA